jgi:hypothetical protein
MKLEAILAGTVYSRKMTRNSTTAWALRILPGLLLLALATPGQAQFTFATNNGVLTITEYSGSGGAVTIPDRTNDLPITSIGDWAFEGTSSLDSLTMGGNITNIGTGSFAFCMGLTNITIGSSVASIGGFAFEDCYSLASVTIPPSVTSISTNTFAWCITLATITIPGNVSRIPTDAFLYSYGLTNVTICEGVSSIDDWAFYYCTNLVGVTIPGSVTNIGTSAFYDCYNLAGVTIPGNIRSIGSEAFAACPSLSAITVDPQNSFYASVDGVLFDKCQTTLVEYPSSKAGSEYTVPDSVTSIREGAFGMCTSLTSVTVPAGVTNVGDAAFTLCRGLTGVYFEGNAPSLGLNVFYNDTNLTVYYLPGAANWGTTFGGCPTVPWNPQIQTGDATFGARADGFGFKIGGSTNLVVVVEACTNLSNPIWSAVSTNALTNGASYFIDSQWTNYPQRFYRLGH